MPAATGLIHLRKNYPPTIKSDFIILKYQLFCTSTITINQKNLSGIIADKKCKILILNQHKNKERQQLEYLTVRPPWQLNSARWKYLLVFYVPTRYLSERASAFERFIWAHWSSPRFKFGGRLGNFTDQLLQIPSSLLFFCCLFCWFVFFFTYATLFNTPHA